MPLTLDEIATTAVGATPQSDEPEFPVPAEPDLMAQTLPLPTAELIPSRAGRQDDASTQNNLDTVAAKARIIGSWKILGDTVPPYVPESAEAGGNASAVATSDVRAEAAAKAFAEAEAAMTSSRSPVGQSAVSAGAVSSGLAGPAADVLLASGFGSAHLPGAWHRESQRRAWPLRLATYRIAAVVFVASLLSMWPARGQWDLGVAPIWARVALLLGLLQLAYAAWLASIPDRASLWATMFVLMVVAVAYGTAGSLALTAPVDQSPPLGIEESMRSSAPVWCFEIMLVSILVAYISGHAALRVRKQAETEPL
jgi:hypothetical protein